MNQYSAIEKVLHNLVFKSWSSQVSFSNIETKSFKKKIADIRIERPVFITALPRAGTTLLLEICVKTGEFVSHTYRDMPFLLTPLFWNRYSKIFKRSATSRERAHGDGMMISEDSPEAFEEIIWKGFWHSRFKKNRIVPWSEARYPEFEKFLDEHLRKIIFLRTGDMQSSVRYVSKNNLNIARIGYLKSLFPYATIVVPFRAPLQHASSLLRQHLNFLKIHEEDSFASKYMKDIGHFDFGKNLRPIDFDNWISSGDLLDPTELSFWLKYWIVTYRHLLTTAIDHIKFISYDSICEDPGKNLEQFGKLIEVRNIEALIEKRDQIVPPKPYSVDLEGIPQELQDQAETLYNDLRKVSMI